MEVGEALRGPYDVSLLEGEGGRIWNAVWRFPLNQKIINPTWGPAGSSKHRPAAAMSGRVGDLSPKQAEILSEVGSNPKYSKYQVHIVTQLLMLLYFAAKKKQQENNLPIAI